MRNFDFVYQSQEAVEQTIELPLLWDSMALVWRQRNTLVFRSDIWRPRKSMSMSLIFINARKDGKCLTRVSLHVPEDTNYVFRTCHLYLVLNNYIQNRQMLFSKPKSKLCDILERVYDLDDHDLKFSWKRLCDLGWALPLSLWSSCLVIAFITHYHPGVSFANPVYLWLEQENVSPACSNFNCGLVITWLSIYIA